MTDFKLILSIIIPFHNRAELLKKTILSIKQNTQKNYEIILVDDESTEDVFSAIENLLDTKTKYYKLNKSERGFARNYGAKIAKGKYLNFFDSDDICYDNHVSLFDTFIVENNYPNIFANSYSVVTNKRKKHIILNGILNNNIFKKNILSCNGVFIKKKIFDYYKFSENKYLSGSEDWDLWLRIATKETIFGNNKISSVLNDHQLRSTKNQNLELILKRLYVLKERISDKKIILLNNKQKNYVMSEIYSFNSMVLSSYKKKQILSLKFLIISLYLRITRIFDKRNLVIIRNIIQSII